ncbi:MAG: hypothetical protein H7Z75_07265 [Ferruginibacter sp.]|nr:hypothetical protein [Cytophagales bacterium]
MNRQSYSNHSRYHPIYHFFLLPATALFVGLSVYFFVQKSILSGQWAEGIYFLLAGLIAAVVVVLVRSNPLRVQERVIRSEIKLRYLAATGQHLNGTEKNLRTSQMTALRFASDEELPRLVEQTVREELPAGEIKKRIRKWKGDYHRL